MRRVPAKCISNHGRETIRHDTLNPFISATTYANTFSGFASAEITYSFEVTGPSGVQVPVDLAVNGSHSFSAPNGEAVDGHTATFSINDPLTNGSIFYKFCAQDTCNFSSNVVDLISTNEVLNVFMYIDGIGPGSGATSQTSLDKTIAIDPANTVSGAALVFSPGLVVSTPEPAAFWLSLAGFVCAAFARPLALLKRLI